MKLVLASTSPRRNELLRLLGIPFEKRPSNADETHPRDVDAVQYVQKMARQKGFAVAQADGEWILSGDTIVALDGRVVGKPADETEAYETLRALRGRAHDVYTALCLRTGTDDETVETLCATDVHMRDYSEKDLAAYVASVFPFCELKVETAFISPTTPMDITSSASLFGVVYFLAI